MFGRSDTRAMVVWIGPRPQVNNRCALDQTALLKAAGCGYLDVVEQLIASSADLVRQAFPCIAAHSDWELLRRRG
eukprot:COSAG01_NODE_3811_length_5675_cov_6.241930_4_plen_75_part_00